MFPIEITKKEKYTTIEILKYIKQMNSNIFSNVLKDINKLLNEMPKKQLINIVQYINNIKKPKKQGNKMLNTNETKIEYIMNYINTSINEDTTIMEIYDLIKIGSPISLTKTITEMKSLKSNILKIENNMNDITNILDDSIYGHNHAKNQILKIIGQWMNGEQNGYCFC
jgi:hypothetical protein